MKLPKTTKTYCPSCKKHTEHKVSNQKFKGLNATHHLTTGSKKRTAQRGTRSGTGNFGTFSRPPINSRKMCGRKTSKNVDLRYTCNECKKIHTQKKGFRTKKPEFK